MIIKTPIRIKVSYNYTNYNFSKKATAYSRYLGFLNDMSLFYKVFFIFLIWIILTPIAGLLISNMLAALQINIYLNGTGAMVGTIVVFLGSLIVSVLIGYFLKKGLEKLFIKKRDKAIYKDLTKLYGDKAEDAYNYMMNYKKVPQNDDNIFNNIFCGGNKRS